MSEADYAELVERREIGPCGKHLKMFWITTKASEAERQAKIAKLQINGVSAYDIYHLTEYAVTEYCSLCREIEQAVAGAYEAAAQAAYDKRHWFHVEDVETPEGWDRPESETPWGAIRSLDSSAARLAKQRIRESALREAAAEIHPEDFDEGSSENCALLAVQHIIIQLIDKPGGK